MSRAARALWYLNHAQRGGVPGSQLSRVSWARASESAALVAESGHSRAAEAIRAKTTVTPNAKRAFDGAIPRWCTEWRRFMVGSPINACSRNGHYQHTFDYNASEEFRMSDKSALPLSTHLIGTPQPVHSA